MLQMALKEWAVAVKALEEGRQIIAMRKGGIREETRDFELAADTFWLFPTYEHQRAELLKPTEQPLLEQTLADWNAEAGTVSIGSFARVVRDVEVSDYDELMRLHDFHIWTEAFADERLKWKRTKPLHVLLLRVYKLPQPVVVQVDPVWLGCKSWISLGEIATANAVPALSDSDFAEREAAVLAKFDSGAL